MARNQTRETFELVFPELSEREAIQTFQALYGTLMVGGSRLFSVRSFVLELEAGPTGFVHRMHADQRDASYLANQLRVLIPGIRVTPVAFERSHEWSRVVEVGMRRLDRTLRIDHPERVSASLLASMRNPSAIVLYQWVLSAAHPERPPIARQRRARVRSGVLLLPGELFGGTDNVDLTDRKAKLSEANFLGVLRIAVRSDSPASAHQAIFAIRSVLMSVAAAGNRLYARSIPQALVRRRLARATAPLLFPIQLSLTEAAALSGWPLGAPHVAGLPQARTRHLPPTASIPSRGLVLARATFPGAERPLAISAEGLCMGLHVVGPTGTGKTSLLTNLGVQVMRQGFGLVVVETKSDLFRALLERIPKQRLDDVVIMDLADSDYPIGFNILAEGNPRATVEHLCGLFERLYHDTRGVWTREMLFHSLATLTSRPGYAFPDLVPLLAPMTPAEDAWRNELTASLTDPELKGFWERHLAQPRSMQDRIAQPVLDRVWQLNARPEIRHVIGQSQSSFRMADVVAGARVLLINLSGIGPTTAALAGNLLLGSLWRAVQATKHKRPIALTLDEFQDHVQFADPAEFLAKARSFGLGVVAAHQNTGQLPPELRSAILANGRSKVVFQTTADDARVFTREFGRAVTDADFLNLGQFEIICRLATKNGVSQPVTGITMPPTRQTGLALEARTLSRERYSRSVNTVAEEIAQRRRPSGDHTARRPKLGGQEWP